MADKRNIIHYPALLLCEGQDEKMFLIYYIEYLIANNIIKDKVIEIKDFGGNEQLLKHLRLLANVDGFEKVKSIAVIRDAETDYEAAISSIERSVENSGIDKNLFCNDLYYLLPCKNEDGNWQNGTLEDLCVQILDNDSEKILCAETLVKSNEFLNSIEENSINKFKRRHKNLLNAYFSATDKFVGMKIGEAANAYAFKWNHEKLNDLKEFIIKLANKGEC